MSDEANRVRDWVGVLALLGGLLALLRWLWILVYQEFLA